MKRNRTKTAINAGSMADIAFLLLIFFLTTTSIYNDKGINVTLPKFYDGPLGQQLERNVAVIRINDMEKVLFEKKEIEIDQIQEELVLFIENSEKDKRLPAKPSDAIVSIQNDPKISYELYMQVYTEIKSAYRSLFNKYSNQKFGKNFAALDLKSQNEIRKILPVKISEAEYIIK